MQSTNWKGILLIVGIVYVSIPYGIFSANLMQQLAYARIVYNRKASLNFKEAVKNAISNGFQYIE